MVSVSNVDLATECLTYLSLCSTPVSGFIDMPELIQYMHYNYSQWKTFEDQGIHTLADIKSKQLALSLEKHNIAAILESEKARTNSK